MHPKDQLVRSYLGLVSSYARGFARFASARIAALSLGNAVLTYRLRPEEPVDNHPYADVVQRISGISKEDYDAFDYQTDLSGLIYLTTLLDTFLSDTTKFLLLLHPSAIGKNQSVTLESVLSAKSTADLVNEAAAKKVREISYLPFLARIDVLRQKFGLHVTLTDDEMAQLEHYAEMRNAAVHDQAVFDCTMELDGSISLRQKACDRHPTQMKASDVREAQKVYESAVRQVCRSVLDQVLKAQDHPAYASLGWIFKQPAGPPAIPPAGHDPDT